jgi:hypothetical protein
MRVPAGHDVRHALHVVLLDGSSWNDPGGQVEHTPVIAPRHIPFKNCPPPHDSVQAVHAVCPDSGWYIPALHSTQLDADPPVGLTVPRGHAEHMGDRDAVQLPSTNCPTPHELVHD